MINFTFEDEQTFKPYLGVPKFDPKVVGEEFRVAPLSFRYGKAGLSKNPAEAAQQASEVAKKRGKKVEDLTDADWYTEKRLDWPGHNVAYNKETGYVIAPFADDMPEDEAYIWKAVGKAKVKIFTLLLVYPIIKATGEVSPSFAEGEYSIQVWGFKPEVFSELKRVYKSVDNANILDLKVKLTSEFKDFEVKPIKTCHWQTMPQAFQKDLIAQAISNRPLIDAPYRTLTATEIAEKLQLATPEEVKNSASATAAKSWLEAD